MHRPRHHSRFSRSWLRWLLAGAAALLLFVAVHTAERVHGIVGGLHPERLALLATDLAQARTALGVAEPVNFRTSDGLVLRGWYTPSSTGAAVVFLHGKGGNRVWFLAEARALVQQGIGVLLYDARASGESDGTLQTWGDLEQRDLQAALDFVAHRPDVDPARIGVQGFSVGAATAMLVAARDQRVQALVLNTVWTSLEDELRYKTGLIKGPVVQWILDAYARQGVHVENVRPVDHIAELAPRPLLLVVGDQDKDTPLEVSRAMFQAARAPKDLMVIAGAGHGESVQRGGADYLARVSGFFRDNLLARPAASVGLAPLPPA